MSFDPYLFLSAEHMRLASSIICAGPPARFQSGIPWREPDLIIAPDGKPYLYRWHVVPRNKEANIYFHIQVADDPERPLHDHPWDNMSVILAGGYDEFVLSLKGRTGAETPWVRHARAGQVIFRKAEEPHRLLLASDLGYTMTLFSTGPHRRDWGFWFPDGWRSQRDVIENHADGTSTFKGPTK